MGNDYPTVRACGLKGRVCDLSSYPACDRHSMVGVSNLPGDPPQDPNVLKQWVDGWVGTVHSYAGICKLPAGKWGVYYGRRGSAPLIPVTSEPTPKVLPETTPETVHVPETVATPEVVADAGVAQAAGLDVPISVGSPDPEGSSSFSIVGFIRSIQEFGEGLIPASKQKEYGIYGVVGVGAIAFLVGAFALVRRIAKRARPERAKAAPPPVPALRIDADAENLQRGHAAKIQLMLAVHEKIKGMEWYRRLTSDHRVMAMRSFAEGGGMFTGYRSTGDSPAGGVMAQVMVEGSESVTVLQEIEGERIWIKPSELVDGNQVDGLEKEYQEIIRQIDNLKTLEHSSSELMKTVDGEVLARALLLEKHMMISEGEWLKVENKYMSGKFSLKGPLSPEWITECAVKTNWGVEGRGDPLGPVFDPNLRPTPVPPPLPDKPIPLNSDMKKTTVGEFSPHFAQLLSTDGYSELDKDTQDIILENRELFQEAIEIALKDRSFRRLYLDEQKKVVNRLGIVMVLDEVLSRKKGNGIDITGRGGFRDLRREVRKPVEDSWIGRLRIRKSVRRRGK